MREPAKMLPFKQPPSPGLPARWPMGIDRRRVGVYVGLAVLGGFALGFLTARFISTEPPRPTTNERQTEDSRPSAASSVTEVASQLPGTIHKVIRVVRADTVELEGIGAVKMIGVETPDGKAPQEIYGAHGKNALTFTEKSLLGQDVRVEFDPTYEARGNKDSTGQTVAYLYTLAGVLFNGDLIRQGHAFVRVAEPFRLIEDFRVMERDAMQAMRGVWGLSDGTPSVASAQAQTQSNSSDNRTRRLTPLLPSEIDPKLPPAAGLGSSSTPEPLVVVSSGDRMYHKSECQYLGKKKQTISQSQARSEGYTACSRCFASTVMKAP